MHRIRIQLVHQNVIVDVVQSLPNLTVCYEYLFNYTAIIKVDVRLYHWTTIFVTFYYGAYDYYDKCTAHIT